MKYFILITTFLFNSYAFTDAGKLPLNSFQIKGTHNSYHLRPNFQFHYSHDYDHPGLAEQLNENIRQLELDLHIDQEDNILVQHLPFIDFNSNCRKLKNCLQIMANWSKSNPGHFPVFVWLEIKNTVLTYLHPKYRPFTVDDFNILEDVILRNFERKKLIIPIDLIHKPESLLFSVKNYGWPTLKASKGKFIFILLNTDSLKSKYLARNGEKNILFTRAIDTKEKDSIFFKEDEVNNISKIMKAGYHYTCNTDKTGMDEKETLQRISTCLKNGAHIISGDSIIKHSGTKSLSNKEYNFNKLKN